MGERKTGLDRFLGKDLWVLTNCNIRSVKCSKSWVRVIESTETAYVVNEASSEHFDKTDDGMTKAFIGDDCIKEGILTERKEYNKADIALIVPEEVLTTEELFNK